MQNTDIYAIRPAGRHILTIGKDLIHDNFGAVIELVKNAYDADAKNVNIEFVGNKEQDGYTITVSDDGHGMSRDTIINKWMVPSTNDKNDRNNESPGGRIMQGNKGIGRYAAAVLGNLLELKSTTADGEETTVIIDWNKFETAKYLNDVEILIETKKIKKNNQQGTSLKIEGNLEIYDLWIDDNLYKLEIELKKLISPVSKIVKSKKDKFYINLAINNFEGSEYNNSERLIEPYPLFELFDYRISGTITNKGMIDLCYSQQNAKNTIDEKIKIDLEKESGCGNVFIDIRVYDGDPSAIEGLIKRGLKNPDGSYFKKMQARRLLKHYNGIAVYRNGFRIRPLGDPGFDWLALDSRRVNNPSLCINSSQGIGIIQIESDNKSGLIENSGRNGLKENYSYTKLRDIIHDNVLPELEVRRFRYRKKAGLGRKTTKIEQQISSFLNSNKLTNKISKRLKSEKISAQAIEDVLSFIATDNESKKNQLNKISETVAIYQSQATLGKIISILLHEGKNPLSYFNNKSPRIIKLAKKLNNFKPDIIDEIIYLSEGFLRNSKILSTLFNRISPLSNNSNSPKVTLNMFEQINIVLGVFENKIKKNNVKVIIKDLSNTKFLAFERDIYAIFTNLIDNSLYWMEEKKVELKTITINIESKDNNKVFIDYFDTGPGIEPRHIEDGSIFDPEFTTKPQKGTGLGLAIAGEAANRCGLKLFALPSETGAYFRLESLKEEENENLIS